MPSILLEGGATVESGVNLIRFVVTLTAPAADAVTVNYRTLLNGTADNDDLFFNLAGPQYNNVVTFAPGETSREILIQTRGDNSDERDEAITLELFDPSENADFAGGVPVLRSFGIIHDNDGAGSNLSLFVSDPVRVEGDSGIQHMRFEVRLSQPAPSAFSVSYTTADGSATADQDYSARAGTLNFATGQTVAHVLVPLLGDRLSEATENFSLIVTPPAPVPVGTAGLVGTATLLDNDSGPGPVISITGGTAVESGVNLIRFVVTLSEASADQVTVNFRTLANGTADADDLFFNLAGPQNNNVVTFAPGETSRSIYIQTSNDKLDERDEHITVQLFDPTGAAFAGGVPVLDATGFILDDPEDGVGPNTALAGPGVSVFEGHNASHIVSIPVELSRPPSATQSFSVAAAGLTATLGVDFELLDSTVTFAPGQTSAAVRLRVFGDAATETAETLRLLFTPLAGSAVLGVILPQVVTIQNGPGYRGTATERPDLLTGTFGTDSIFGKGGNDTIFGGNGNDALFGDNGNDQLFGAAGNDGLTGGNGNDLIDGGGGGDRAFFLGTIAATVNLSLAGPRVTGHGTDTLVSIEHVTSGSGNDRLTGNAAGNSLVAGAGRDTLKGGAGNDVLYGGGDNDRLTGDLGADAFVFNTAPGGGNVDRITDFNVLADTIRLENAVFAGLAAGILSAAAFRANASGLAADATDRIIYDTDSGNLFFDADGTGGGARVLFAIVDAGLALNNGDFLVI